ncbi:MAG: DUF424 family protein [Candidatus Bathyarchaeota archaeon]|jgi:hypothetical protein|nr:DUF424 family protein [Candidatus Bathyarchaeota archaeon]
MNIKKTEKNVVLALCDVDMIGRTLCEGKIVFQVHEEFYKGRKMDIDEALMMIENSTIVNMIGKNVVQKAIEKGYVHPDAVLSIEGVPHAQIVKL